MGKVCSLVEHFFSFLLSFCSESTYPLDLNYSSLFFREIANKLATSCQHVSENYSSLYLIIKVSHSKISRPAPLRNYVSLLSIYKKMNFSSCYLWYVFILGCVIENRAQNFTSFSYFPKKTHDSSPTTIATARQRRFDQSDVNKNSLFLSCSRRMNKNNLYNTPLCN